MKINSRKLVLMALLIAMAILLRRVLSIPFTFGGVNFGMVSFGGFPIILAGLLFGPLEGGLVGIISDLVGFPLMPRGPYIPFLTITAGLTGIIPALIFSRKGSAGISLTNLFVAILAGQVVTKVLLVPYFLNLYFPGTIFWNILSNTVVELVHVPLYTSMAYPLLRSLLSGEWLPLPLPEESCRR